MYFTQDDDDDENDFGVAKSSHLSNIFGNLEGSEQQNASLRYVPPKQPKKQVAEKKKQTEDTHGKLLVIHSSVVTAYKFEDGKYNHQGKLGFALLGNYETRNLMLLLYKDKQNSIAKASVNLNFVYTVQDNNYANFYDDLRINWSIHLDNLQSYQNFALQVAIAKVNSTNAILESQLIQDTSCGSGPPVSMGETIYIKYCCWILSENQLSQVLSSNWDDGDVLKQIKVGDGSFMNGFDAGIVNIKRGGQRVIILQSHHFDGRKDVEIRLPDMATVVLRVEVKLDDQATSTLPHLSVQDKPSVPSKPASQINVADDATIKARGATISEQLQSSPKVNKAKLISRMAKMGQPLLPVQSGGAQSSISESDTEEEKQQPTEVHPIPNPRTKVMSSNRHEDSQHNLSSHNVKPVEFPSFSSASAQPVTLSPPQQLSLALTSGHSGLPVAATPPYVIMPGQAFMSGSSSLDSHVPVLLSEVRTQNTELRMQMSQVTEKLERVLEKVGQNVMYPNMEVGVLAENINRVLQENEKLKQNVKDKDARIETLSERLSDLLQSHQRVLEKSNTMLEQRSDHLQYTNTEHIMRVNSLEQEKARLQLDLTAAQSAIKTLELKLGEFEASDAELRSSLKTLQHASSVNMEVNDKVDSLTKELNELRVYSDGISRSLKVKEVDFTDLANRLSQSEKDFHELKAARDNEVTELLKMKDDLLIEVQRLKEVANKKTPTTSDTNLPSSTLINLVKKVMSALYKSLQQEFLVDREYSGKDIKAALVAAIRQITLEVIENYSEVIPSDSTTEQAAPQKLVDNQPSTSVNVHEEDQSKLEEQIPESDLKEEVKQVQPDTSDQPANSETNLTPKIINTSATDESIEPWRPQPPPFVDVADSEGNDDDDDWLT
ncbi:FK506-binding protein 15 [Chamberlinius hualienensis]